MNTSQASLLRQQMRYRRNHLCIFPRYVVENRDTVRKFHRKDIPIYIFQSLKAKLAGVAK